MGFLSEFAFSQKMNILNLPPIGTFRWNHSTCLIKFEGSAILLPNVLDSPLNMFCRSNVFMFLLKCKPVKLSLDCNRKDLGNLQCFRVNICSLISLFKLQFGNPSNFGPFRPTELHHFGQLRHVAVKPFWLQLIVWIWARLFTNLPRDNCLENKSHLNFHRLFTLWIFLSGRNGIKGVKPGSLQVFPSPASYSDKSLQVRG